MKHGERLLLPQSGELFLYLRNSKPKFSKVLLFLPTFPCSPLSATSQRKESRNQGGSTACALVQFSKYVMHPLTASQPRGIELLDGTKVNYKYFKQYNAKPSLYVLQCNLLHFTRDFKPIRKLWEGSIHTKEKNLQVQVNDLEYERNK